MTQQHTPEPWVVADHNKSIVRCFTGERISNESSPYAALGGALSDEREANARRIVSCVNALTHISTEQLESGEILHMGKAIKDLTKQRDDLLAALEAAIECGMVPKSSAKEGGAAKFSRQVEVADMIRAAVSSVKGGA